MQLSETSLDRAAFALRPDVVATVLDDGAVLLDLETKYFYALNASGWSLAQLFESGATAADAERFARASGAAPDDGVRRFVTALVDYGLVEEIAEGAEADVTVVAAPARWSPPTVERQAEPLQQVIASAFDPSMPLAE